MQALILAGGQGTRLRPLTLHTPKPVVPLVNRPFLAYQIEILKRAGVDDIILSLNYNPSRIEEIMGGDGGAKYGVKIRYLVEPAPMGTAGGFKFAADFIRTTTVVFNGDILTNLNISQIIEYHRKNQATATIILETVENPSAYGLVEIDEKSRVLNFLEKPKAEKIEQFTTRTVNAGIYVLEPKVLDFIPEGENYSFEYGLFPDLLRRGEKFQAFVQKDTYWLDIGIPQRYLQAHYDIINKRVKGFEIKDNRANSEIYQTSEISENSFVGNGCTIKAAAKITNSVLGKNVFVGERTYIENSVIGANSRINDNAHVSGAIIGQNCRIGSYSIIDQETFLGDKTVLTAYSKV